MIGLGPRGAAFLAYILYAFCVYGWRFGLLCLVCVYYRLVVDRAWGFAR